MIQYRANHSFLDEFRLLLFKNNKTKEILDSILAEFIDNIKRFRGFFVLISFMGGLLTLLLSPNGL
jgi:hypothetical protein